MTNALGAKALLILAWGLYDLANQFFALNVVSLYFVRWITMEKRAPEIFYSVAFGISTFFIAFSAPILGNFSDRLNKRMPFLIILTLVSVIFTMILGISENIFVALVFFAIANFGCQAAVVFYNALLADISPKDKIGFVSGFGRTLGYSGALLALCLIKPIVLKGGYRAAFFPTGLLFLIFSLPCMIFIKDKKRQSPQPVKETAFLARRKIFESPGLSDFLKAAFFSLCVVNAIILFMSVYATKVFKLNEAQIINLIAFSTLFAIAGSFISGYISDLIGSSRSLLAIIVLWEICILTAVFVTEPRLYWLIGCLAGTALGSIWTVSRALAIRIAPQNYIGEVFGLFNLIGYISAIVGSVFWGVVSLALSPLGELGYRITLFSLSIFLVFAFVFLSRLHKVHQNF